VPPPPTAQQIAAQAAQQVIQTTRTFDERRNAITNYLETRLTCSRAQ
jgi:hypothetical protein